MLLMKQHPLTSKIVSIKYLELAQLQKACLLHEICIRQWHILKQKKIFNVSKFSAVQISMRACVPDSMGQHKDNEKHGVFNVQGITKRGAH